MREAGDATMQLKYYCRCRWERHEGSTTRYRDLLDSGGEAEMEVG